MRTIARIAFRRSVVLRTVIRQRLGNPTCGRGLVGEQHEQIADVFAAQFENIALAKVEDPATQVRGGEVVLGEPDQHDAVACAVETVDHVVTITHSKDKGITVGLVAIHPVDIITAPAEHHVIVAAQTLAPEIEPVVADAANQDVAAAAASDVIITRAPDEDLVTDAAARDLVIPAAGENHTGPVNLQIVGMIERIDHLPRVIRKELRVEADIWGVVVVGIYGADAFRSQHLAANHLGRGRGCNVEHHSGHLISRDHRLEMLNEVLGRRVVRLSDDRGVLDRDLAIVIALAGRQAIVTPDTRCDGVNNAVRVAAKADRNVLNVPSLCTLDDEVTRRVRFLNIEPDRGPGRTVRHEVGVGRQLADAGAVVGKGADRRFLVTALARRAVVVIGAVLDRISHPEALTIGEPDGLVADIVVAGVCDPEDRGPLAGIRFQRSEDLDLHLFGRAKRQHPEVPEELVAMLVPVLEVILMPDRVVDDVVLDQEIIGLVKNHAALQRVVDGRVLDEATLHRTRQVEVHGIAPDLTGDPETGELGARDLDG